MNTTYSKFAQFYDSLMGDAPYEQWLALLEKIRNEWNSARPTNGSPAYLDLGCGTGTISTLLAKQGGNVIGVDLSEEMLSIAEEKRQQLPFATQHKIQFLCQDMTELRTPKRVDIAFSFCDSMNYLQSMEDLDKTLARIYNALNEEGYFIFDMLSLHRMERQLGKQKNFQVEDGLISIWETSWDHHSRIYDYDVSFLVQEQGNLYRRYDEIHHQRIFSVGEVQQLLEKNNFTIEKEFADFIEDKPIDEAEYRYLWITKKR